MNTYRSVVKKVRDKQALADIPVQPWDDIKSELVNQLEKLVKERKARISRARCDEKVDHNTSPFETLDHLAPCEEYMFNRGKACSRSCLAWTRTRFVILECFCAILRSETSLDGELSDCAYIHVPRSKDPDPMEIVVKQMGKGKTVTNGKKQYAKFMRHKDVRICAVGAMAMYLAYRFYYSGEFVGDNAPDWGDNKSWFRIKILTDGSSDPEKTSQPMNSRTYSDKIRDTFKNLGIHASVAGHWGRHAGPLQLELMEIPPEWIRLLGMCFCVRCFEYSGV